MNISILNILNQKLASVEGVFIKVITRNDEVEELIYSGRSDSYGQIIVNHNYVGKVSVYIDHEFHSELEIPCVKSLVYNQILS